MTEGDPQTADLSLVDTADLVEELSRRHDGLLVVRERVLTPDTSHCAFDYSGGLSRAIGLAVRAQQRLLEMAREG